MEKVNKIFINNILFVYLWCILNGYVSYNEELALSSIYIVLFIIISVNFRSLIVKMIIDETLKLMFYYEQLLYLKIKIIHKNLRVLTMLLDIEYKKNIINLLNFEIKKKKKNYINNKVKIYKILKIYYLFFFLLSKIFK
jgi:hypothetical protein